LAPDEVEEAVIGAQPRFLGAAGAMVMTAVTADRAGRETWGAVALTLTFLALVAVLARVTW
jgi:hypothetical protein